MRIVLAGDFPDDSTVFRNGTQAALYATARALAQLPNYDIHVVTNEPHDRANRFGGFTARHSHGELAFASHHLGRLRLPRLLTTTTFDVKLISRMYAALRPSLIHVFGAGNAYALAAVRQSTPFVISTVGPPALLRRKRGGPLQSLVAWLTRTIESRALAAADAVIAPTPLLYQRLQSLTTSQLLQLALPVDSSFFEIEREPVEPPVVLYVGRVEADGGLHYVVRAISHLRKWGINARLRVAGLIPPRAPRYADELREFALATEIGKSVRFLGQIDRERLQYELRTSAAVVLPYRQERLPTVLAEVLAAGCPLITTATPTSADIITSGQNGYRLPLDDDIAIAESLHHIFKNPDHGRFLGENGRATAASYFHPDVIAQALSELYQGVLRTSVSNRQ